MPLVYCACMQFIIILIVIVALGSAVYYRSSNEEAVTTETPQVQTTVTENTEAQTENQTQYADGVYEKSGLYTSPAGSEEVAISITLKDDVVTDATFKGAATNPGSVKNQEKFAQGFKDVVVGEPIDSIALTVVNGSSLTPKGFMNALEQVKTDARI